MAYANYKDCKDFCIKPELRLWGEFWVRERIKNNKKTLVELTKFEGLHCTIYKKTPQPHLFHNIVYQPGFLPFHTRVEEFDLHSYMKNEDPIDLMFSYDSAICLIGNNTRTYFWKIIEQRIKNKGILCFAYLKFITCPPEAISFLNKVRKKSNLPLLSQGNFNETSLFGGSKLSFITDIAKKSGQFKSSDKIFNDNSIVLSYPELIDEKQSKKLKSKCPSLKDFYLTFMAISISFC